jgi:glycerol dehydrogenase
MAAEKTRLAVFASPERYVQGRDATEELGKQLDAVGVAKGCLLIVASGSPKRLLADVWRRVLPPAGYEPLIVDFGGRCTAREVDSIAGLADRHKAVAILASGGGQVIDAARAAAELVPAGPLPVVSCPSVASTDAPCSALSVIYDDKGAVTEYRFFKRHPVLVLVDTAVVARSPKRMLIGGLGDAAATFFESRACLEAAERGRNFLGGRPTATGMALSRLCWETLVKDGVEAVASVEARAVTPALERVVEANTLLSGLGFESGGICLAHACHNGLTTCHECAANHSHGEKVAFGLCTQLALEGKNDDLKEVQRFCSAVGLPITLKGVSVDGNDDDLIRQIAERTVQPGETSHNMPFAVDAATVADAIRAADRLGVLFEERRAA